MFECSYVEKPRLVIIVGPTASGKTRLAIELAERFEGEIISADSMQVYKYMDIGTAKPTPEERKRIPHHMIDVVTPDQSFNAALYRTLGRKAIQELQTRRKSIFVVGGTGLYVKTLTHGLFSSPKIDPEVRERLRREAEERGALTLYQRLQEVDPETASVIHPNDLVRIIRALEVFESTKLPISFYRRQHAFGDRPYSTLKFGLDLNREELYRRIEKRVEEMLEKGFLQEVERLLEMGYGPELKPMQGLGYKHLVEVVIGKKKLDDALREIKRETRRYAKRQLTWFKADPEVVWVRDPADRLVIEKKISSFLKRG